MSAVSERPTATRMTSLTRNSHGVLEGLARLLGKPVTFGWDSRSIRGAERLRWRGFADRRAPPAKRAPVAARRGAALVDGNLGHAVLVGGALGHAARAHVPSGVWAVSVTLESIGR
jgi:hypothetical protein